MSSKYRWDVFLSHNSRDKPQVRRLAERLRGDGLRVWLDEWEIQPGDSIPSKLMAGLEGSRVLLMLLSKNFDESDWSEYETGSFLFRDPKNSERRFIPVRLDQSPIRDSLRLFAWVDWSAESDDSYQRLVKACTLLDVKPSPEMQSAERASSSELPTDSGPEREKQKALTPTSAMSLGHTDVVRSVAVSEYGHIIVTGCDDGVVRVIDRKTNRSFAFEGHSGGVLSVALTPDGPFAFVSAANNGVLRFWPRVAAESTSSERTAARYVNAKVLLVGESKAGKTGLAMRIATGQWEPTESTDGHWATRLNAVHTDNGWGMQLKVGQKATDDGIQREVWLWDFAGQSDYRLIHQMFMDKAALVVLVFDPQSDRLFDSLGRWDHDIKRAARGDYQKLLVAARTDVGGLRTSRAALDELRVQRGFADYLETSARNNVGITELENAIGNHIDWDKLEIIVSNETFDGLKTGILGLRDAGRVLIRVGDLEQQLRLMLPDLKFSMDQLTSVIGHLAAPGLVWNLDFGDFLLLQPEKINCYAGAVIRTLRDSANALGIIAEDDVEAGNLKFEGMARLPEADEAVLLQAMHQTFVKRGLCIQQKTEQGTLLVFPAFFGVERPADPVSPPLLGTYEFAGFLDDVYATLVVRLHHVSGFASQRLWKDYAEFTVDSGVHVAVQLTRGKEGRGALLVHCDHNAPEDDQVLLFRYVHEHVKEKGEDWQRTRHYVCGKCGRSFLDDEETRSALEEDGEKAVVVCTNRKCKTEIVLWDAIEQKFASEEFRNRVRALREASLISIDNESRELILEGHARVITGQAGQIYRGYTNSDHGIDGEIEFKDDEGHATGERLYLQLKSGDSHLRDRLRDRTEVFDIKKPRWAEYWAAQKYPVMLVIRTSDGRIRWFNATEYLCDKQAAGEWPVSQIIFEADDFSVVSILEVRRSVLQSRMRRMKPGSESGDND